MTTAEALAVVRGLIVGYQDVISLPDVDRALDALAEIEERLEQLTGRNQFLSTEQVRADLAERRVAELEAALRELLASGIDDVDPRLGYVYIQADREAVEAARRALGGGE